jgi:hydrogenase nickel incorporation protein HypA/HybF
MHELAVTENILEIATRHGLQALAKRVTDIYIDIGILSSIVDDSIQFYWDIISQDTICVGAILHFQRLPAKIKCLSCGSIFELIHELAPCSSCGSSQITIISGEEFSLQSIDVER